MHRVLRKRALPPRPRYSGSGPHGQPSALRCVGLRPPPPQQQQQQQHRYHPVPSARYFTASAHALDATFSRHSDPPVSHHSHADTIYALSTAHGRAGIAVVRISGPSCMRIYHALCPMKPAPRPRFAALRTLIRPGSGSADNVLDSSALVLSFPGPNTVTGEDVLELHIHGGSATVKAVLSAIPAAAREPDTGVIRYAEPGEFTRRAFINGRLDLAQVEALSETLSAETEQQRRAAVRGNSGSLGRSYEEWRSQMLRARAEMEALIDFSEDQHFDESPVSLMSNVTKQVRHILRRIAMHEDAGGRSELLRSGIKIALLGPPNVGKSSLMNQLVGREASIVSGESGTTRDIIEANLDIRGYLCTFADTAGFRSAADAQSDGQSQISAIEEEGIRRARAKALDSDVIAALVSVEPNSPGTFTIRYDLETLQLAGQAKEHLVVVNKRDTVSLSELDQLLNDFRARVLSTVPGLEEARMILISCKEAQNPSSSSPSSPPASGSDTGRGDDPGGIGAVADTLVASFSAMTSLPVDLQDLHGVTERQRQLLAECRRYLEDYVESAGGGGGDGDQRTAGQDESADITVAAEYLRYAANCLGRITGRGEAGDTEEILGVIFEKFCVGK